MSEQDAPPMSDPRQATHHEGVLGTGKRACIYCRVLWSVLAGSGDPTKRVCLKRQSLLFPDPRRGR